MIGFLLAAILAAPPAFFEVSVTPVDSGLVLSNSVELPATGGDRHAYIEIVDGDRTLLQVHIDSHEGGWHEVALTNGSIESSPGFWSGDYSVRLIEDGGSDWSVERSGALFYDGTGYLELLGRPTFDPQHNAAFWYYRLLVDLLDRDPNPYLDAIREAPQPIGLESYPHKLWSADDWHVERFDKAYSTHQTGSPSVKGYVADLGAHYGALWSYGASSDTALAEAYLDALWGKVGQQCRRQLHFYHDVTGNGWSAAKWPNTYMGEWGPTTTWGATETWGRVPPVTKGKWNGFDDEHLEVDTQAMAWVLFGSKFALREMRHKLDGVLTHPHAKASKESTPRIYGWSLKALSLGAALDPDPDRAARYRAGAELLVGYWNEHFRKTPRHSMQSVWVKADGRHLFPDILEVSDYFAIKGWEWPKNDPLYLSALDFVETKKATLEKLLASGDASPKQIETAQYDLGEAEKKVVHAVAAHVYQEFGSTAQFDMMRVWGWVACFHTGTIAAGLRTYADMVGDPEIVRDEVNDLLAYMMLEARNQGGGPEDTFWYDTSVWLPGRNVGTGKDTVGVVEWVAGGLGMLGPWVPGAWRPTWKEAVDSVYLHSKAARPGEGVETCTFESWFLPYAAEAGYP